MDTTWKKGFTWRYEYRVCGKNLQGELVYDRRSGKGNVLRPTDTETWICSETGFQIRKIGGQFELTHPSLDERDVRTFQSFKEASEGIWEFTCCNVYCDWHRYPKFKDMLASIAS